jgi:glycosyltransferase involved in cell wall biosynthesis
VTPALEAWVASQRAAGRSVLTYVGGLNPRKNVAALIEALATRHGVALLVCGDGPLAAALRERAAQPELQPRVLFLGQVGAPQAVVALGDALVLPSRAEGMPLVALEAAAAGRPCLLSNIAVHRELAAAGLGVTFDHRRFTDFDLRLSQLLSRPQAEEARRLHALWRERFTADRGFEAYRRLWEPAPQEIAR